MTWASLVLVIVLGGATLLTHDPRFVLAKPAIGHFAIGAIMLKRGWMLRYMPPIVTETIPEYVTAAGYAWAVLMFRARRRHHRGRATGDIKLWALYVSVVLIGAKVAAFAVQYVAFRILVTNRIRAAPAPRQCTIGHGQRDALYRRWPPQNHSGFAKISRGDPKMAVDGNWNIVMSTPMGERKATLTLTNAGGTLTGNRAPTAIRARSSKAPSLATTSPGKFRSPTRCR